MRARPHPARRLSWSGGARASGQAIAGPGLLALLVAGCGGTIELSSDGHGGGDLATLPAHDFAVSLDDARSAADLAGLDGGEIADGPAAADLAPGEPPEDLATGVELGAADLAQADLTSPPDLAPTAIRELVLVLGTGAGVNDGTDDAVGFCLTPQLCWRPNNTEINDFEAGQIDHFRLPGMGLSRNQVSEVTIKNLTGPDAWKPTCVAVIADGELLYCDDRISVTLGNAPGERGSWSAADPRLRRCASCYGSPITHGPMVGHTTPDSARIWLRAGSSLPVEVEASTDPNLANPLRSPAVTPLQSRDFTATARLTGLAADRQYYYRLRVGGAVVGQAPWPAFRTAPSAGAKFAFAFGSCAKDDNQPIFDAVAALDVRGLLMIGDNHYANSSDTDTLRFFYRHSRGEAHFRRLLARTPTWAIWDDHDFVGNNTDGKAPGKERALAAFGEYWANAAAGSGGTPGIWHSFQWGQVELFLLDDRYWRGVTGTMLGQAQHDWLLAALAASQAKFKVLVSGSQWTPRGSADSWASFDAEREQILSFVFARKIPGLLLLSGDIHRSEVRRLKDRAPGIYPIYEFTSSPLATDNSNCPAKTADLLHCVAAGDYFGVLRFDTTVQPARVTYESRDQAGKVVYSIALTSDDLKLP